uniref:15.5 kDa protein n=1 Tax=Salmo salar TaxID=8030 RepID=B5X936_SALSA|nr:15.5 kDa protein [Salmo salar]
MGLLQKVKTEFLLCERGKEELPTTKGPSSGEEDRDAVEFLGQIKEIVSKHRNNKILLAKPKSYELRIGGLEDTVHAGDGEQLEVWKDCYLPERMEMVVIGALDDFRCSAAGWQLVLLLCEDGNVYAYEFEVLHLVARSLEDLFETGAEFPGLEKFRFGECFEELSEEEMKKEMQCDEIKKIDDEHIHFRRRLQIEMLEDLKAISQSEVIMIQTEGMRDITKHDKSVYIEIRESLRLK